MKSTCSSCPVADVICRTIELGLTIEGALIGEGDITIIHARPTETVPFCPKCGAEGVLRDHVVRELTDLPVADHPSRLQVRLPRYLCVGEQCPQVIFQHRLECAAVGAKTTNRCTKCILQKFSLAKMSVKAVADELGLGWDLVNRLALTSVRSLVYDDPTHLEGVKILGVDEHCWQNAVAESFFSHMKIEMLYQRSWPARLNLRTAMLEYMEIWYNRKRPHNRAGGLPPTQARTIHQTATYAVAA